MNILKALAEVPHHVIDRFEAAVNAKHEEPSQALAKAMIEYATRAEADDHVVDCVPAVAEMPSAGEGHKIPEGEVLNQIKEIMKVVVDPSSISYLL